MRVVGLSFLVLGIVGIARPAGALRISDGGPYEVDEGSEIELAVLIEDVAGQASIRWDLDRDESFGDGEGDHATFRADGMLGGLDGTMVWVVRVSVIDEDDATVHEIPITIWNVPPTFRNLPGPVEICVGESWAVDLWITDPIDPFVVTVDDTMPPGATFQADQYRLDWTPGADAVGHHAWVVTAADDDGGVATGTIEFDVAACGAGDGDGGADADTDADGDAGADAGADVDGDGGAGGDADSDSDSDSDWDDEPLGGDDDETPPGGCGCRAARARFAPRVSAVPLPVMLLVALLAAARRARRSSALGGTPLAPQGRVRTTRAPHPRG